MGNMSDFAPLSDWPFHDHQDAFNYAEALRDVCSNGAQIAQGEHAYLLNRYTRYVANRIHMWEKADRGGLLGSSLMQKDARGIAREVLRPLEVVALNLKAAQVAAASFPHTFYKHLDPVINPRTWERGGKEDFSDKFPNRRSGL
jgi:hypothetical protein